MTDRQERIGLLARASKGKELIPSFLTRLEDLLGDSLQAEVLVPIQETDVLITAFRNGYQTAIVSVSAYRRSFLPAESGSVYALADCLAVRLRGDQCFFLTKLSDCCGAVRVATSTLLSHAAAVIAFDGDSLYAVSIDGKQGILIDFNQDDRELAFEVAVWGDEWSSLARACEPRASELQEVARKWDS